MRFLTLRISEDDLYDIVFANFNTPTFEEFTQDEWDLLYRRWRDLSHSFKEEALDHLEDIVVDIGEDRGFTQ